MKLKNSDDGKFIGRFLIKLLLNPKAPTLYKLIVNVSSVSVEKPTFPMAICYWSLWEVFCLLSPKMEKK